MDQSAQVYARLGVSETCRSLTSCLLLAANPSTKRSLQPAFDAAAAQAGMPLYELQPFEPLLLEDTDPSPQTPGFPGAHCIMQQPVRSWVTRGCTKQKAG